MNSLKISEIKIEIEEKLNKLELNSEEFVLRIIYIFFKRIN